MNWKKVVNTILYVFFGGLLLRDLWQFGWFRRATYSSQAYYSTSTHQLLVDFLSICGLYYLAASARAARSQAKAADEQSKLIRIQAREVARPVINFEKAHAGVPLSSPDQAIRMRNVGQGSAYDITIEISFPDSPEFKDCKGIDLKKKPIVLAPQQTLILPVFSYPPCDVTVFYRSGLENKFSSMMLLAAEYIDALYVEDREPNLALPEFDRIAYSARRDNWLTAQAQQQSA